MDHLTYEIPDYVKMEFEDAQPGPSGGPGFTQFHLEGFLIRGLTGKALGIGPLIRSVYLILEGGARKEPLSAQEYLDQLGYDWLTRAPEYVDSTGSLVTSKNGDDLYRIGFPRMSVHEANQARSIRFELVTPELGTVPVEYNLATLSLSTPSCPECGGELTQPRKFNLMFRTFMGPVEEDAASVYLRPETAQGIFVNFNNVVTATRRKLPFGIAQIGKAFRNEITTGNFIFRTREFEMMEIEYFVRPGEDEEAHGSWVERCLRWYTDLGVDADRLRVRVHDPDELSHYSKATHDIEYQFPWGWGEIQGIANRTDYDLRAHSDKSGESLEYFDDQTERNIVPYVVEPSAGVDRAVMTFLVDAYTEESAPTASGGTERRVVMKLHPALAPVKVAILPLSRNEKLVPLARSVYDEVRRSGVVNGLVQYDDAQSIGRRYRRQDEIGTPKCVTVDFDSLEDNAVTVRDRDSMAQVRVPITGLADELRRLSGGSDED